MTNDRSAATGGWLRDKLQILRHYHQVAEVGEIARRYFAMNGFDGVLTILGVLIGSYLGDVDNARTVIIVGLTTAVGMSVSGFYGSYLVERAERGRAMRELEESTLSSLKGTDIHAASIYASIAIAIVDGASPFIAAFLAVVPFIFAMAGAISVDTAYYAGVVIAFVEMFLLGVFLGVVSRERIIYSGVRFMFAGFIALALSLLLETGIK